jgi:hypothetical protein
VSSAHLPAHTSALFEPEPPEGGRDGGRAGEVHITTEAVDLSKVAFVNCRRCVVGYHAKCFPPALSDYDAGGFIRLWAPHTAASGCQFKYTGDLKIAVRAPSHRVRVAPTRRGKISSCLWPQCDLPRTAL